MRDRLPGGGHRSQVSTLGQGPLPPPLLSHVAGGAVGNRVGGAGYTDGAQKMG